MALTQKLSNAAANAEVAALAAQLDGGFLDIYTGTQPPTADDGIGSAVLLASLQFGSPAFGAPSNGSVNSNPITDEDDAPASGVATWYRCYQADHVTTVQDGSVGTVGCNLNLTDINILLHAIVSISSFSLTASKS